MVATSTWTGTLGVTDSDLPQDWEEAKKELEARRCGAALKAVDTLRLPPEVAGRIWEFFQKEFPEQAYAVLELYLDS